MSAMTDFFENKLVDNFFRTSTYTRPAVLGIALFTAAPGETGGGTECTGGSYARVDHPPLDANWESTQIGAGDSSGTGGLTDNLLEILFPSPTTNWGGQITHMAIFDATTSGNMLIHSILAAAKNVSNGDPAPSFPIGDLDITFA